MTKAKYEEILTYLRGVIEGTQWEGKVYTVGGCLRDALMGHDIHDVDLAVNTPDGGVQFPIWLEKQGLTVDPPTLYRRFSSSRLKLKAFPEEEIEVVQTRREQYTDANSRNPEVCFGTVEDDCLRRDLTINSLYQNVTTGELLDITGRGVSDIRNREIRTPMEPDETYSDDPIRILRTLRFAVRYGWRIPDDVWQAMKDNAPRMKIVRRPRVATEFEKMILSDNPVKLLRMMREIGVIFRVMPELCNLFRHKDHSRREELGPNAPLPTLWDVTMERLEEVVGRPDDSLEARYAALLSQFNKVRIPYSAVTMALKRLMYKPDFIRKVKALLPYAVEEDEGKEKERVHKGRRRRKDQRKEPETRAEKPAKKKRKAKRRRRRKPKDGSKGTETTA